MNAGSELYVAASSDRNHELIKAMESLTKLAAFSEKKPAEALVARLRSSDIEADIHDESNQQKWQLWNMTPLAHLHVRVSVDHERTARALLIEWAANDGGNLGAVRCPECGSFSIEYPQFSRKTLVGALPSALAAAGVIERGYYCETCHFTWPAKPEKPGPELDILNWPKKA